MVINRPFRATFEATIKSHERDQRSDTADRVRIVESIGLRIGVCAGAFSIRNYNNVRWLFGVLAEGVGCDLTLILLGLSRKLVKRFAAEHRFQPLQVQPLRRSAPRKPTSRLRRLEQAHARLPGSGPAISCARRRTERRLPLSRSEMSRLQHPPDRPPEHRPATEETPIHELERYMRCKDVQRFGAIGTSAAIWWRCGRRRFRPRPAVDMVAGGAMRRYPEKERMTKQWGGVLRGHDFDLEDWREMLKPPFDPWIEVHGSDVVLRSESLMALHQQARSATALSLISID